MGGGFEWHDYVCVFMCVCVYVCVYVCMMKGMIAIFYGLDARCCRLGGTVMRFGKLSIAFGGDCIVVDVLDDLTMQSISQAHSYASCLFLELICTFPLTQAATRLAASHHSHRLHPSIHPPIHLRRRLPHRLNILLQKLPLKPRIRHTPRQTRLRHLLQEPQTAHRTLPIRNIPRLQLNERHARIVRRAVVDAIAQVAEPGGRALGVEGFDAGVVVGGGGDGAGDGDPVLGGGVLEGELGGFGVGDVGEFGGVFIGEEEKVGTFALKMRVEVSLLIVFLGRLEILCRPMRSRNCG